MTIFKRIRHLKQCEEACKRIYELMTEPVEDHHGNVSPYRWDKTHNEIFKTLEKVGYKRIVGIHEWSYQMPWKVAR